ncbi:hypothetical protein PLICRDRAFT_549528 [Plicaturopsis crispa FD-325 SS-3]|nr:hypothetical protein PLICRDRAFT_549528 [Plicaturopsis crispa FD-325 SS-3]
MQLFYGGALINGSTRCTRLTLFTAGSDVPSPGSDTLALTGDVFSFPSGAFRFIRGVGLGRTTAGVLLSATVKVIGSAVGAFPLPFLALAAAAAAAISPRFLSPLAFFSALSLSSVAFLSTRLLSKAAFFSALSLSSAAFFSARTLSASSFSTSFRSLSRSLIIVFSTSMLCSTSAFASSRPWLYSEMTVKIDAPHLAFQASVSSKADITSGTAWIEDGQRGGHRRNGLLPASRREGSRVVRARGLVGILLLVYGSPGATRKLPNAHYQWVPVLLGKNCRDRSHSRIHSFDTTVPTRNTRTCITVVT